MVGPSDSFMDWTEFCLLKPSPLLLSFFSFLENLVSDWLTDWHVETNCFRSVRHLGGRQAGRQAGWAIFAVGKNIFEAETFRFHSDWLTSCRESYIQREDQTSTFMLKRSYFWYPVSLSHSIGVFALFFLIKLLFQNFPSLKTSLLE